ncbi:amidohydrolase family protein [Paenibacillus sp. DMB20]|uniref:amidohydrolase family protein n=1 Tax=Paenibacillus sp. DMB20 TaxID=1642570 RepID=UPI000AAF5999|nr:amidohydrolase family protein [Paenibacillus sp. DMB20]
MGSPQAWSLRGIHYATGEPVEVVIREGFILSVSPCDPKDRSALGYIGPGLVDLQINGYAGHDFNSLPLSADLVPEVTAKLWREGVTSYCPTVITNGDREIGEALRRIAEACEKNKEIGSCIAGIHLEGPFITPEDGPRGAHDRKFVKPPDWELFQRWQEAAGGRIAIVTLSPEWDSAASFIERCVDSGVAVSIGHTAAAPEQIREAVRAGASLSTHLAMGLI